MTDTLLHELLERSFLFDDPATYRAGVVDALTALRESEREARQGQSDAAAVSAA